MEKLTALNVLEIHGSGAAHAAGALLRATLQCVGDDGRLTVATEAGQRLVCDWLDTGERGPSLASGDVLLVATASNGGAAIVIGRVGRYQDPATAEPAAQLRLAARESLSLTCGASSIDLRADGKVLIRGDDVLVRAKGTKRIRAGTVSIN